MEPVARSSKQKQHSQLAHGLTPMASSMNLTLVKVSRNYMLKCYHKGKKTKLQAKHVNQTVKHAVVDKINHKYI
eukprot:m.83400 g.83400  ORF g.83400 m.83400 type:complete len:74 (+) comp36342_c0_seq8:2723-2944(+)